MKSFSRFFPLLLPFLAILLLLLAGCGALPVSTLSPTPTAIIVVPTAEPSVAPTSTPTSPPTATPIPPTATPTLAPTSTPQPAPTATPAPALTSTPTPEQTATPRPTATPIPPAAINGMPYSDFILMDEDVKRHISEIYDHGHQLGRNSTAFSKLGDSLIANPYFLRVFDQKDANLGPYNLGDYIFLQNVIDHYRGSYDRYGVAIHVGLHTWSVFDPMWAPKEWCNPGENLLDCEIRLHNPSLMLVLLGTNDDAPQATFETNYDKIVQHIIAQGIVPILFTKADRFEGPDNRNNISIKQIAAKYQVPVMDFDNLANTIPNRGLGPDGIHLSIADSNDYTLPETFRYGNTVHNLATLIILNAVRDALTE